MTTLISDIRRLLVRELDACIREVRLFPDDESLWTVPPGIANSAGNLALHLCGNLRHFVGASLASTGYQRDRAAEFSRRDGSREEIASALRLAIDDVERALAGLDESALDRPMPNLPNGLVSTARMFLLHLVAHTAFHLGQMGYLRRVLSGEGAASAGPLPLDVLADDVR